MTIRKILKPAAWSLLLFGGAVFAHHGDAGRYMDETMTVSGTVVEFQFVNPHSLLTIEVEDESGNTELWYGELGSPSSLSRNWGWDRNTFQPGQEITMTGRARKNGEPFMTLTEGSRLVDAEGKEIYSGDAY